MSRGVDAVIRSLDGGSLTGPLRDSLILASRARDASLAKWCRLELQGYFNSNPALDEQTEVPAYRTVAGQHRDIYGRPLVVEGDFSFINETRLRNGVVELEHLLATQDAVSIHDPGMCETIREHLHVDVYSFTFSVADLTAILTAIRIELQLKLQQLVDRPLPPTADSQDVLILRPNVYGIGVDLRALWSRINRRKRPQH